jgi:predicted DNA-binding transcriptional regulator AlpA
MDSPDPTDLLPLPADPDVLILRAQVPRYLPMASQTLARLAVEGGGPRYVRVGRSAAYRAADLRAWLDSRSRHRTAPRK